MSEISKCPFCGGKARVTAREYMFGGYNGLGERRWKYQVRVMCNRCHAYGPSFNTGWVKTSRVELMHGRKEFGDNAAFDWAEKSAIEQWNKAARVEDTDAR